MLGKIGGMPILSLKNLLKLINEIGFMKLICIHIYYLSCKICVFCTFRFEKLESIIKILFL